LGEDTVTVLGADGHTLSPTARKKAEKLLAQGQARRVSQEPLVIQLTYTVALPRTPEALAAPGHGRRILLHICCGPCATYPIERLRAEEFQTTGFWYNPNVQPSQEHERRRQSVEQYARVTGLSMIWHPEYELMAFLRGVVHHEAPAERCLICYRMRLERTAEVAAREGFDAFTTTLLISPHQDQQAIRSMGETIGEAKRVGFYFENFRRGWSQGRQMARAHGLYRQQYCGCVFSEWERYQGMSPRRDEETH